MQVYEGEDDSPLHRMAAVMATTDATYAVRITHDDIIIDSQTVKEMLNLAEHGGLGYVNSPKIIDGAGVEIIHRHNLMDAAKKHGPTEFVSYFVKDGPLPAQAYQPRPAVCRPYRMTMDYLEDYQALDITLRALGADASTEQVCRFLDENSWVARHNALPLVTVYTCAFNAEKYVEKAMDSVMNQRFHDFEYIFVDDASTDRTPILATKWTASYFRRPVKLILNQKNLGLASSSNIAVAAARGRYIVRLDADDELLPDALRHLTDRIERTRASVVYPAYYEMDMFGYRQHDKKDPAEYHHAGGAIMNTRLINELRFRDGLKHWDSLELYNRLRERFKPVYLEEPTFLYRRHADSMSMNNLADRELARKEIGA